MWARGWPCHRRSGRRFCCAQYRRLCAACRVTCDRVALCALRSCRGRRRGDGRPGVHGVQVQRPTSRVEYGRLHG
eukprot:3717487-Prymnesium_polylepis.1